MKVLFIQPIYNIIILLFFVFRDAGLVIVVFAILIKLIFWPLTAKTIHSQKKLQDLAPDLAEIKKKAAGDKQKESQMMMELYREKGVNPFSSCLPTLYQLPFLYAIFAIFRDLKIDPSLIYEPIQNLGFIKTLIESNSFHPTLLGFLDLTRIPLKGGFYLSGAILALVMGFTQYLQGKMLQPKKSDQTQALVGQFNLIFPAVFAWFSLTTFPLALTLYWTVFNLVNILQQKLILEEDLTILRAWKRMRQFKKPKES